MIAACFILGEGVGKTCCSAHGLQITWMPADCLIHSGVIIKHWSWDFLKSLYETAVQLPLNWSRIWVPNSLRLLWKSQPMYLSGRQRFCSALEFKTWFSLYKDLWLKWPSHWLFIHLFIWMYLILPAFLTDSVGDFSSSEHFSQVFSFLTSALGLQLHQVVFTGSVWG